MYFPSSICELYDSGTQVFILQHNSWLENVAADSVADYVQLSKIWAQKMQEGVTPVV